MNYRKIDWEVIVFCLIWTTWLAVMFTIYFDR